MPLNEDTPVNAIGDGSAHATYDPPIPLTDKKKKLISRIREALKNARYGIKTIR